MERGGGEDVAEDGLLHTPPSLIPSTSRVAEVRSIRVAPPDCFILPALGSAAVKVWHWFWSCKPSIVVCQTAVRWCQSEASHSHEALVA